MTPLEHNKYVGWANIAYGAIHILMIGLMGLIMIPMMGAFANVPPGDDSPMAFFGLIMGLAVVINTALSIPNFVAGYAFLKQKPWAKVAGIISAVVSAMSVPIGTAVCVYTFWFLFSEPGKVLYEGLKPTLPPPPPENWGATDQSRTPEYAPAPKPVDWR